MQIKTSVYKDQAKILVAVDCIIFGFDSNRLNLLLFKRKVEPLKGKWSLVGAFIKDFPLDIKYSVTSFTLSADNDEGTIDEAPCQGNTWSPKALNILRGLVGGRTVTVDNIRAVGPDGQSRKIPSLVYYIK